MGVDVTKPALPPADAVPVTPATPKRLQAALFANAMQSIGAAILTLQMGLPQVEVLFPRQKWIGPAVFLLGHFWETLQKQRDLKTAAPVNYSAPGGQGQ